MHPVWDNSNSGMADYSGQIKVKKGVQIAFRVKKNPAIDSTNPKKHAKCLPKILEPYRKTKRKSADTEPP
jgi:hypothetical protein